MSYHSVLAVVGGLVLVYHLLRLVYSCCCGLGEFVLSAVWQVDLRTYGKWAGRVGTRFDWLFCGPLQACWF